MSGIDAMLDSVLRVLLVAYEDNKKRSGKYFPLL
jgi:hypothetical protein